MKLESVIVAAAAMARVLVPLPPFSESAVRMELFASRKRSLPAPPIAVIGSVSFDPCVNEEL